ncbi:MAG: hypothetical protein HC938_17920 [Nitrospira sp.]|nr:hypothetical protein [Nitrospira sp.]
MSIPFSVAEVQIFHSLETLQYGYATWAISDPKGNPNNLKVNFDLIDSNGRVLVRIIELASRPLRNPDSGGSRAVAAPPAAVTASRPLYYQKIWVDAAARMEPVPPGDFLIFDRSEHVRDALQERLHGQPQVRPRVSLVKIGSAYRELEQDVYEIDPGQEEHYGVCFSPFRRKGCRRPISFTPGPAWTLGYRKNPWNPACEQAWFRCCT